LKSTKTILLSVVQLVMNVARIQGAVIFEEYSIVWLMYSLHIKTLDGMLCSARKPAHHSVASYNSRKK